MSLTQEVTKKENESGLQMFKTHQFLNFCLGFFGLQFAWQMRIILSGPVTESLGASPFLFGLIWLAGPFTGMVVQPIVGVLSDKTTTRFGRRRPYLLGGALLASLALWGLPNAENITAALANILHISLPTLTALFVAAVLIWVIDACVNIAQGPYRALVPDIVPAQQHGIANSFFSFAIGLGSVVAAGAAPFLKWVFDYQMDIHSQFVMAALAFSLGMLWTCCTIKEKSSLKTMSATFEETKEKEPSFNERVKEFFAMSPEIGKICGMQFFTWIGVMSMFIFFTQYVIHTIYGVPDLTNVTEAVKSQFNELTLTATNFSSTCFAVFNLVCFLVSIPIGILSTKYGNKKIHIISLATMVLAYLGMAFFHNPKAVVVMMAIAGIGWASILALPFAMLSNYIKKGSEGSVMGIFNIFIAGPQVLVCTLLAWVISKCAFEMSNGFVNFHWELAFIIGAIMLACAAVVTNFIKEK